MVITRGAESPMLEAEVGRASRPMTGEGGLHTVHKMSESKESRTRRPESEMKIEEEKPDQD